MWNRVVEKFGYESTYESFGKYLPVPVHIFRIISRWDQIHFLKTTKYREELRYYLRSSDNPLAIPWQRKGPPCRRAISVSCPARQPYSKAPARS